MSKVKYHFMQGVSDLYDSHRFSNGDPFKQTHSLTDNTPFIKRRFTWDIYVERLIQKNLL